MTVATAEIAPAAPVAGANQPRAVAGDSLPTYRLNLMRAGYLLMGVGLAAVK